MRAERGDKREADDREHEELRRAEGEHQRPHDRDRSGECHGADDRADQRARQSGAERAACFALFGHRIAVDHGGGAGCLARHPE